MTRATDILDKARIVLADQEQQRWSNDILYSFLTEAQQDICMETGVITASVVIAANTATDGLYNLPDDVLSINRVSYEGRVLPFQSVEQIDNYQLYTRNTNPSPVQVWLDDEGSPEAVIFDHNTPNQLRLYPKVSAADTGMIRVEYIVYTGEVSATEDVRIPALCDNALKYYVVGQALMTDVDTSAQQRGVAQLQLYDRHLKQIKKLTSANFTQDHVTTVPYRRSV